MNEVWASLSTKVLGEAMTESMYRHNASANPYPDGKPLGYQKGYVWTSTHSVPRHAFEYDVRAAVQCGEDRHPEIVMREIGFDFDYSEPYPTLFRWVFHCRDNKSPDSFPVFVQGR